MSPFALLADVNAYYSRKVREHGPTPRGVDWNSTESQEIRFTQLLRVCDAGDGLLTPLGDYGCGYGALLGFLRRQGSECAYRGYDISRPMVEAARSLHGADARAEFSNEEAVLKGCDYVVASGIFNVKLTAAVADWESYVHAVLDRLAEPARCGFAFNVLTSYSDPDKRRPDLYYADPCRLFDLCKRRYSRHVSLLHDYGLFEFTMLVSRKP